MLTKRGPLQSRAIATIAAAGSGGPALAQMLSSAPADPNLKYFTPMPAGISSPDKVETCHGTLNFFDGFPDKTTAEKLQVNANGSVDVYFGPKAPQGKESNWVRTALEKRWNTLHRLYGPLEPRFAKTWRPGEIELQS